MPSARHSVAVLISGTLSRLVRVHRPILRSTLLQYYCARIKGDRFQFQEATSEFLEVGVSRRTPFRHPRDTGELTREITFMKHSFVSLLSLFARRPFWPPHSKTRADHDTANASGNRLLQTRSIQRFRT
ncbi:hypothetical protein BV898_14492 [Hypsibius exemplaris]|uniref:Uncharacterized protein n=1 Tax=Hypsibius exemplaris TaxID=2072580 RepID=A0A9X6N9J4_HYPEX|nr:hypothetical protein BV898_14492 [Hypsibius exemplaris]